MGLYYFEDIDIIVESGKNTVPGGEGERVIVGSRFVDVEQGVEEDWGWVALEPCDECNPFYAAVGGPRAPSFRDTKVGFTEEVVRRSRVLASEVSSEGFTKIHLKSLLISSRVL